MIPSIHIHDIPLEGWADITARVLLVRQTRGPLRVTVEDTTGETQVTVWDDDLQGVLVHGGIVRLRIQCSVTRKGVQVYRNRDVRRVRELHDGESLDVDGITGQEGAVAQLWSVHGCACECPSWPAHVASVGGWRAVTWDARQEGTDPARDAYTLRSIDPAAYDRTESAHAVPAPTG